MTFESCNPASGEIVATHSETSREEVDAILRGLQAAYEDWRRIDFPSRAVCLRRAAHFLRERSEIFARLMAAEMGKPLAQGRAEIDKCAWACDFYAENAQAFLAPESIQAGFTRSFVTCNPLGVILAIMPWNFPFWQVFRAVAPALMAGNAVLLKHASNVFGCARAIGDLLRDADLNVFAPIVMGSDRVRELIEHPLVRGVTLTGSTAAGSAVAAQAGAILKKTVLELGGSDPYLVLEDADVESAAETCVASRLINTGQSCIAAKRFIVHQSIQRHFEEAVVEKMKSRRVGNPLDEGIALGPLARRDLCRTLQAQVDRSIAAGARLLLGGQYKDQSTAFYPLTVLTDVHPGQPAYEEETFGPVAAVIGARDEADTIRIANDTSFGLGAAVFTRDAPRGERIAANELQAGCCFVNDFVRSDPRLPFGGIKQSGYGRELAAFGIREFVNIKTVVVK
ncbi:MAG: NAD-dependent succinate-semialdehyde dehydrogenase [Verrucomicrobia subdivision 3 bacterium]|nr:NAD-dependent succinate-semialdehyde dehydrogenase [Limisphaerales bacterium]